MSNFQGERDVASRFHALPVADLAPRDAQDLMAYPFFSLSKSPRVEPIRFETGRIRLSVEGGPEHGIATIWDADVLIWAATQIVQARNAGVAPSRCMVAVPHQILRFLKRRTGALEYALLRSALNRLHATTVATSIGQSGRRMHRFSWISSWREHLGADGRPAGIEIVLPDWFFATVMDEERVLTVDSAYFRLSGGIERWLYRVARKHAGSQARGWRFELRHLHLKSGSLQRYSDFALQVRRLAQRQSIPGYGLSIEHADGAEWLRFRPVARGREALAAADLSTGPVDKLVNNL